MFAVSRLTYLLTISSVVIGLVNSEGSTYTACDNTVINVYAEKWGYIVSDNYPGAYGYNRTNCFIELQVPNTQYHYIAMRTIEWSFDASGYGDRLTVWTYQNSWNYATDFYAWGWPSWLDGYRNTGHLRFYWYTDGLPASRSNVRWKIAFTFQKYIFGCELYPQPYTYPNTTKYGVIKSPFFPDPYPANAYCVTTIDIDQATDLIEFIPIMYSLRAGDYIYFYVGDVQLGNWVQYSVLSSTTTPAAFRIYGADVKIIFQSDYMASSYGYQFYWHIISKERYQVYKPESLIGLWPMTAAHRALDIVKGCDAVRYPATGSILPVAGPFGDSAASLYFNAAYLNMSSSTCIASTLINSSFTISAYFQTAAVAPVYEFISNPLASGSYGLNLWSNQPATPTIAVTVPGISTNSISSNLPGWQFVTISHDNKYGTFSTYSGSVAKYTGAGVVGGVPPPSNGFYIGYRDGVTGSTGGPQTGRFSCLSMYSIAMKTEDVAQVNAMCQKFQKQYEIYRGNQLVGWWPLTDMNANGLIKDFSGNNLHGTAQAVTGVTVTTSGPGGSNTKALNFAGATNAYVAFNYPDFATLASFTISVYIKTSATGAFPIVEFYAPGNVPGVQLELWPNQASLYGCANYPLSNSSSWLATSGQSFTSWTFVSLTYDARTGLLTTWKNAATVAQLNRGAFFNLGVSPTGFLLGKQVDAESYWNGQMACLSIYKAALTQYQLQKLMAACQIGLNQPPHHIELLGFWPLTKTTGTLDVSGNELHGTATSSFVVPTTGPFGIPNTAYAIGNNSNSYLKFTPNSVTNFYLGSRSWTISGFVKSLDAGFHPFFEFVTGTNQPGAGVGMHWWINGGNNMFFNNFQQAPWVNGFQWGQWQFISWVYDSNTGINSMWRDGAKLGEWNSIPSCVGNNNCGNYGFNIGRRISSSDYLPAQVACFSIYQSALDGEALGRVMSMCQSYLMDYGLRDKVPPPETDCNFDSGFCGWTQDVDDDFDWQLGHDWTPNGQLAVFATGPRFGKSAERADALDQYAYISTGYIGGDISYRARLISPVITSGWHCFEFWYYMGGVNVNQLKAFLVLSGQQLFLKSGPHGKQWTFAAVSFFLPSSDQIAFDGYTGATQYSDIAIDSIRVTDGQCAATVPCPSGWLDYGRKCYVPFVNFQLTATGARTHCQTYLKARPARPENEKELAYVKTFIGASSIYLDGSQVSSVWLDSNTLPIKYLPWVASPGSNAYLGMNSNGFITLAASTYGTICEITKLEAQHRGFNCTFDNKHLCGWVNAQTDTTDLQGASIDADTWSGVGLPWYTDDVENGPEWDWNHGNTRGYYLMLNDYAVASCTGSRYSDFVSPIMKNIGQPQCLRFRHYRATAYVKELEVFVTTLSTTNALTVGPTTVLTGYTGTYWRTVELEINPNADFFVTIRMWCSCDGKGMGGQAIDDIELFNSTCSVPLFSSGSASTTNSKRPQPGYIEAVDSVGDNNFYTCDNNNPWRYYTGGVSAYWQCSSYTHSAGFRRTGPQSDYTGEGNYLQADFAAGSLTGLARYSGPAIPPGQHCFIFHYFQNGFDVGELRLFDGSGRSLWSRQRSQNPAWKEHRILFNDITLTVPVFEASSGFWDGNYHLQKYQSLQLDDIYTRNGTDLCLGFMDCDFDSSSYLLDCGWQQNDTDDADWIRNSGETPAGNDNTGPSADHTTGTGHYLYFEATNLRINATARIHMPPMAAGTHCLTFYYYMWGKDVGGLRVFYFPQSSLQSSGGNFPWYSETTLWQRNGEQANFWLRAMVPVTLTYSQVLTFEARRGTGDRGDIAIDDVVLLRGACPTSERSLSCSFEHGDLCNWYNDASDQLNFIVNRGKTKSAPLTGPEGDATGEYAGGYYAYMSAADGTTAGQVARLVSAYLSPGSVCFQLSYNMRGRKMGRLNIYRNSDLVYRLRGATTGYEWRRLITTIDSAVVFAIKIEAVRGDSPYSDIAIDDIQVTEGPCLANGGPLSNSFSGPVDLDARWGNYVLNNHVFSTKTAGSYAACSAECTANGSGCQSANYNTITRECQFNNVTWLSDPYDFTKKPYWYHIAAISKFRQTDVRFRNLCTLDSLQCTLTTTCVDLGFWDMLACRCMEPGLSCYMPKDCSAAYKYGGYKASGTYLIQPDVTAPAFMVWCEMEPYQGRGSTVLVKRYNGGTRFHNRKLPAYQGFFGSPDREYWIGLDAMARLTSQASYAYFIDGSVYNTAYTTITGQYFSVANISDQYRITLDNVGTMAPLMSGMTFSTIDADGTGTLQCPGLFANAGWWYSNSTCQSGLLTGVYRPREALGSSDWNGLSVADFGTATGLTSATLKLVKIWE